MNKNYWPHAIIVSILLIVVSCIATIVVAVKNPVQMDSFYLEKYQNVDENINEITASKKRFEDKYELKFNDFNVSDEASFSFEISPKSKTKESKFHYILVLSKPETNKFNQELNATWQNSILKTQVVKFVKTGRWQLLLKISDGSDTGFYKFDIYVK